MNITLIAGIISGGVPTLIVVLSVPQVARLETQVQGR